MEKMRLQLGFPIAIPLRAIARNCAQFLGVYRSRNCAQVKSTCVGNPNDDCSIFSQPVIINSIGQRFLFVLIWTNKVSGFQQKSDIYLYNKNYQYICNNKKVHVCKEFLQNKKKDSETVTNGNCLFSLKGL